MSNQPVALLQGVPSHDQLRVVQQYARMPQHGLVVSVEQRTTGTRRAILITPDQAAELRDALSEWLTGAFVEPRLTEYTAGTLQRYVRIGRAVGKPDKAGVRKTYGVAGTRPGELFVQFEGDRFPDGTEVGVSIVSYDTDREPWFWAGRDLFTEVRLVGGAS